ncbi:unnamed protein product, partial [Adineta ricciae]
MASHVRAMLNKIFGKPEYRGLFIGLDASGKTTILYRLKLGELVQTIPTIGFNVETIEYNGTMLTLWDVGGCDKIRPLIRHYFLNMQAIIFTVDANDRERIEQAQDELSRILSAEELLGVPILFYLNKSDLPNAIDRTQIIERMQLNSIRNRSWLVQTCSAITGDGLYEGLDWLVKAVKSPSTKSCELLNSDLSTLTATEQPETNQSLQWLSQIDEDSDEDFIDKFQKHQLLSEQFDHRSLLRIIWIYLQLHDRKETIKSVFQHLP